MGKKRIKDIIADEISQFLEENDLELYNVEFVKEAKDWYLRVYIDRAESCNGSRSIGTEDCEKVSRFLSSRLDELDPIEQNYYLEVCSPGIDRALLKDKDYEKYAGKLVDVLLYQAIEGKKTITGRLIGLIDGNIVITDDKENRIEIPKERAVKTKLTVVF
ncbi:ribosome maturation factor RimP [Anaerovorax odorimutans]|uniref:ribosome maturation factor RimP n=1 Tax=Anaerovorax odorimutans TaxID=109327 RepID=UPI000427F523|nr:ribosome maturation factor RimP [Anaerovorax odorimutans]